MATLHKLELYVIDFDDNWDNMQSLLENTADRIDLSYKVASHEQSKEFEWEDDLKINKCGCTIEDYEEYFDKSNFECIYLTVDGKCIQNYCLGIEEKDNKTIDDCPECINYKNCYFCDTYYSVIKNKICKNWESE